MDIVADIALLGKALNYYEDLGYTRVDLPWAVPAKWMQLTTPNLNKAVVGTDYLVASAEQAFLYCDDMGLLPAGRYVGMTPCFRPGDTGTNKQETFYKVELYRTDAVDRYAVDEMLLQVSEFARQELRGTEFLIEVVETPDEDGYYHTTRLHTDKSCDINLNGIEIGSYGLRQNEERYWAYGTGLAEPRFSMARNA